MNRYAMFRSRCRSSSRLRICDWIETSSALTGSSQTMKSGIERQRPGDADALALAAGEFVRVAARRSAGSRPTRCSRLATSSSFCRALGDAVDFDRLADDVADGHARVQAADRVLEDDLHLPAEAAQLFAVVGEEVLALVAHLPAVAGIRRRIVRPTVVLPQPDSPTRPSVLPGATSKLTPSTAFTWPTVRENSPS